MARSKVDQEELALAVVLWRNLRCKFDTGPSGCYQPFTKEQEAWNDRALEMAKGLGVKAAYLRLVFTLPVLLITVKEMEKCTHTEDGLIDCSGTTGTPEKKPRKKGRKLTEYRNGKWRGPRPKS